MSLKEVILKAEKTRTFSTAYFFIRNTAEGGLKMNGYTYLTFDQRREIERLHNSFVEGAMRQALASAN